MAKLADLKALLDAARATVPAGTGGAAAGGDAPPGARARVPGVAGGGATTPQAQPGSPSAPARRASIPGAHEPAPHATRAHRAGGSPAPASLRRHLGAMKHADGDIDLATAFLDVTPLARPNRATLERPRPAPIARQREIDELDALEMSKYGAEPSPHAWDVGQEIEAGQTFVRPGVRTDVLGKLRRGRYSVQAEIDLHGLTVEETRDALADFLLEARNRGLRCVRVIHGKGLTSPNREPVLKGKVRQWLSHWDDVLAYSEAPPHAGGGGAVVVLLKARG
jgi:DNA-nicking Smr family endonuclease